MMRDSYPRRQLNPPLLESMEIVVALIVMAVCWFAWYVARERFYLENRQIAELACLPGPDRTDGHRGHYPYYYRAIAAGETVAPSSDGCISPTGREVYGRRVETGCRGLGLRHPRQAMVLARPSTCDAGHRAGHDRLRQDHASQEHHYAGPGTSGRHPKRSPSPADGDLRWQGRS